MIETIKIEEAVGKVLAHDITEIRKGEFKGPAFRKGHIITCHDIPHLKRLGKDHLYIIHLETYEMHENDAAAALANALSGEGVMWEDKPKEGKITLKAARDGLLKVHVESLIRFNELGEVMCATLHENTLVQKGQTVGATRAIPLVIKKVLIDKALHIAQSVQGILSVLPLRKARVGLLITGNEVYSGRIKDQFEPILRAKVEELGSRIVETVFLPDHDELISKAILRLIATGADLLITTGGMSVDPDDRTRHGIRMAGAEDILYGSAVLPGAMFLLASIRGVSILGIPACALYHPTTIFDLILPRILAGKKITRKDMASLAHGGLCFHCQECRYPICPFGKAP